MIQKIMLNKKVHVGFSSYTRVKSTETSRGMIQGGGGGLGV